MLRRVEIFFRCILVIALALPLVPGPGWLIVAEALAVLEREFVWVRRLMDTLAHTRAQDPRPDSRRPDSIAHVA